MPSIAKPLIPLAPLARNDLGLTIHDYEGSMSTLCAGCGHDSITAAIVRALWELPAPPHMIAKLSGIGCSSKTPTYFVAGAHGFNTVHGRMAAIATGARAANRELIHIGVSGDGDSVDIGLGHLAHAIRRNVRLVYVLEDNGVYGLTKGQFSATADTGSRSRSGEPNTERAIDPIMLGLSLGATFLARGFSGDKAQLVPILKAAIKHRGFALIHVISPCVQFNNHDGSTKSYRHVRDHDMPATLADFVAHRAEIRATIPAGEVVTIRMHNGDEVRFSAVPDHYDPTDRQSVTSYLQERQQHSPGEIVTGLLYLDESLADLHEANHTPDRALTSVPYRSLCPGADELARLQASFR